MMKSFFKKLAFVMALAMVVSLAAPAATTASAAGNLKIAYQNGKGYGLTELNIAEVGATEDLKFLGAPSNWKELGATWTSNNEAVATVDQAGIVTAVAPGTAEVAVQIGAEVAVVKVNVVNVATYTATMGTTEDRNITAKTIEEGDTFDFAFYGIKDYDVTRYFCTWASDDTSVATVDQKGLVTAVKAGTAKITLIVFNKVTGQVHNVDACTVTVPGEATPTPVVNNNEFTVAQKGIDTFVLTFNEEKKAEDIENNLKVELELGDSKLAMTVAKVTVDGKDATVELYADFDNGEVYSFTFVDETAKCTTVVGEIAKVDFTYYTGKDKDNKVAYVAEEEENDYVTFVPSLYDAAGNDITAKYDLDDFDFEYEITGDVSPYNLYKDTFVFYNAGLASVKVTASWIDNDGELQTAPGEGAVVVQKRGAINVMYKNAGLKVTWAADDTFATYENSNLVAFQTEADSPFWTTHPWMVMDTVTYDAVDPNKNIYNFAGLFGDDRGNTVVTGDTTYQYGYFTFKSSNENVLTVDDNGVVVVEAPGKANILIYFTAADGNETAKFVGSKTITVKPAIYPVTYKILSTTITTASHVVDDDLNNVTFKLQVYDQNGDVYWGYLKDFINIEALYNDGVGVVPYYVDMNWAHGYYEIKLNADHFVAPYDNNGYYADETVGYDGSAFLDTELLNTFRYKVTFTKTDVTETIKTNSATFALTIKNTKDEHRDLAAFLGGGDIPRRYFKYSISGGDTVDVAVKNVIDYCWNDVVLEPTKDVKVKYVSSGNLDLAYVRSIVAKNTATTGAAGTVYYKVTAPTKSYSNGAKVNWDLDPNYALGKMRFTWNNWTNDSSDAYAVNGTYGLTFYTTKIDEGSLFTAQNITYTISNSQAQVVCDGFNPEYGTVTKENIPNYTGSLAAADQSLAETIIKNNLVFRYHDLILGDYADMDDSIKTTSAWGSNFYIDWSSADTVVTVNADKSIRVAKLAIVIPLDDRVNSNTYTCVVNVGKTIYQDK